MDEMKNDDLGTPLKIVSFCIPLVGAILYFVKKDAEPNAAKQACNMALIGVGVSIVLNIILTMTGAMAGSMG